MHNITAISVSSRALRARAALALIVLMLLPLLLPVRAVSAQTTDVGFEMFRFASGTGGATRGPTGEKPESKLWFVDGRWYSVLRDRNASVFTIYTYNPATSAWVDTGVPVDDRLDSKADVLWDGSKLYIASHTYIENAATAAPAGQRGELYRYSYNAATRAFSLDGGFPVEVNGAITETLVIDKDSSGTLWVTYVQDSKVMVNHSLNGNDALWGVPYALPAGGMEDVDVDDVSSLIAYNGRIGVMWSRQLSPFTMYFAIHPDGAPDSVWTRVGAYGASADDHISLKSLQSDSAGNVYAVVKTANNSALIMLLVCKNNINRCSNATDWDSYPVYTTATNNPTRPIMMLDVSNRQVYVFVTATSGGKDSIYYKKSSIDSISFNTTSIGTAFIRSANSTSIDDATSTKQNVSAASGLMVIASDRVSKFYLYNYLPLGAPPPAPTISGFSPTSGPAGTTVTITGTNFTGASAVAFNGAAASFTVSSASQISAVVPAGAATGKISVTTPGGTATSAADFTVPLIPPQISAFSPASGPVGTIVTINGSGFSGATQVTFGGAAATSYTVVSATQINATVPAAAVDGPISVTTPMGTATSTLPYDVTIPVPVISSFTPATGPQNTQVTINGSNFGGASSVTFNGLPATFSVSSAVKITAYVPLGASTGPIQVTTPGGTATSASSFTVTIPVPTISSFSPTSGPAGTTVTINGSNFTNASAVTFNGTAASFNFVSAAQITAVVPVGATTGRIKVTTPGGTATSASNFTVTYLAPKITSFSPSSGPVGTIVTITGSSFNGTSAVAFNNTPATNVTVVSDTQINATVAAGTTSGQVSVTTPGGKVFSTANFVITAPPVPVISGFAPALALRGWQAQVQGSGLSGATSVRINGTSVSSANYTVVSDSLIQVTIPSGASSGVVAVTTPGGTATSATSLIIGDPIYLPVLIK